MKQTERNEAICAAYLAGATCQALADEHGITRQRVNQITRRAGLTKRRVVMYENKEIE